MGGRKRVTAQAKASTTAKSAARAKAAAAAARKRKATQKAAPKPAAIKAASAKRAKSAKSAAKAAELRAKAEPKKLAESKTRAPAPAVKPAESPAVKPSVKQAEVKLQAKPDVRPEAAPAASAKAAAPAARAAHASPPGAAAAKTAPAVAKEPKAAPREEASKPAKSGGNRHGFKLSEFVVYPAHGVGQIVSIEEQEVAGFKLELFVINFSKDKMTLRVPTAKVAGVGMRKISDPEAAKRSLEILTGRARIKRTMWSRRAQEYESKINSGDINAIAEVVRDLYRSEAQPEQSYSERQLYEAALDRMVREIAAVNKSNEIDALKAVEAQLQKSNRGPAKSSSSSSGEPREPEIEEAA